MKDALDETLILSDRIIQDLVADIIVDFGVLYKASEAVALLDMLWSFAHASIREYQILSLVSRCAHLTVQFAIMVRCIYSSCLVDLNHKVLPSAA